MNSDYTSFWEVQQYPKAIASIKMFRRSKVFLSGYEEFFST